MKTKMKKEVKMFQRMIENAQFWYINTDNDLVLNCKKNIGSSTEDVDRFTAFTELHEALALADGAEGKLEMYGYTDGAHNCILMALKSATKNNLIRSIELFLENENEICRMLHEECECTCANDDIFDYDTTITH